MVQIPLHIWEVIRQHTLARYDLADLSDEELAAHAAAKVEEKFVEYERAKAESVERGWESVWVKLLSIDCEMPKEELLKERLEELTRQRQFQRELRDPVNGLKVRK